MGVNGWIRSLTLRPLGSVLLADNVLKTCAAEFLWRVSRQPGYQSVLLPVREAAGDEDWMSLSARGRPAAAAPPPPRWLELQRRSELMRRRTTRASVPREEILQVTQETKQAWCAVGWAVW